MDKIVDGQVVEMSKAEVAAIEAEWAANEASPEVPGPGVPGPGVPGVPDVPDNTSSGMPAAINELAHQVEDLTVAFSRWAADSEERDTDIMATLDDLVAAAASEDTKIDSLIALTAELKARVDKIVAGELSPEQQAQLDAAFAAISDNPDRIQAAIDANTP